MAYCATSASHLLTDLSVLVESLPWLRSIHRRQESQTWHPIKCGPSLEPVSVHLKRFRDEWAAVLRSIAKQCPSAADQGRTVLQTDPLRPDSDTAISDAMAAIRHLSDPRTIRSMAREHERHSFGGNLRRLRVDRGLSLRGLAAAYKKAAKRFGFHSHSPNHVQIVRYEAGRLGAHPRTVRVIAAALGVRPCELEPAAGAL